jgi:hypothetical protein
MESWGTSGLQQSCLFRIFLLLLGTRTGLTPPSGGGRGLMAPEATICVTVLASSPPRGSPGIDAGGTAVQGSPL